MNIVLDNKLVTIEDDNFLWIPTHWVFDSRLEMHDLTRLCRLWWRYAFFADLALKEDENADLSRVFYPTQEKLCELLGFSVSSRTKCGIFLKSMEIFGYIKREKSSIKLLDGNVVPRHYITVVNKAFDFYRNRA